MVIVKAADKTAVDSSTQVGFISRMTSSSKEFVSEIFRAFDCFAVLYNWLGVSLCDLIGK